MATTVDTLLVRIEADLSDLRRDLRRATTETDKASSKIKRSFDRIGKVAKIALAGAVVSGVSRATMSMINLASGAEEMQGKSSVVFGAFRDQVVDALDEFGNEVGRSTYALEAMASSLQDTFVPMGFARGEAAKLAVSMTKLAVDVGSFNDVSEVDTMRAFQSALVGNHETVRQFGIIITAATLNQELLNMGIRGGAKAASEAEKVQARMNLILEGSTDAQGDAARTATSFANELRALKANISEFATEIGTYLLPVATAIVRAMNGATTAVRAFFDALKPDGPVVATDLETAVQNFEAVKQEVREAREELKKLQQAAKDDVFGAADALGIMGVRAEALREKYLAAEEAVRQFQAAASAAEGGANVKTVIDADMNSEGFLSTLEKQNEELLKGQLQLSGWSKEAIAAASAAGLLQYMTSDGVISTIVGDNAIEQMEQLTALVEALNLINAELAEKAKAEAEAAAAATRHANEMIRIKEMAEGIVDPLKSVKDQIEDIELAFRMGAISEELFTQAMEKLQEELVETHPFIEGMQSAVQNMSQSLSDSFADMLLSGKMSFDSLRSIFGNFVKMMVSKAFELFVVNQIMNGIFGGVTGYTPLPSGQFFGRASGGSVNNGQPYLVGERGPELFVPSSAGTVMNNSRTGALGGGQPTVVNQTINVSAGVSQTVKAEMLSLLPRFKQDTMSAVLDAKQRGGSFGQAFG